MELDNMLFGLQDRDKMVTIYIRTQPSENKTKTNQRKKPNKTKQKNKLKQTKPPTKQKHHQKHTPTAITNNKTKTE